MIELVFDDSALGSLKTAHIGEDTSDAYGVHLALSIGDISEDRPGVRRRQTLAWLYSLYPEGGQAAQEFFQNANDALEAIHERMAAGEALRIWYGNRPDEMCGMYWFMARLDSWGKTDGRVSLVRLPAWTADEHGNLVQKTGWAEAAPEEWRRYLPLEKPAPPSFCRYCASHWQALLWENAPLRAAINGQLVSAPETLYDDFIRREIAAEGDVFQEVMVVGRVLGKYQLGVRDIWVAHRIESMIRDGLLEIVSEAAKDMPGYHRLLKKRVKI